MPGILWLLYFYHKQPHRRTTFASLSKVFLAGCACTVPVAFIEHITGATLAQPSLAASTAMSFLLIAPLEELAKLVAVWISVYRSDEFREPIDGLVYAATAALGFACIENVIYVGIIGPGAILPRTAYATPAHVMFSCMWGYSMGMARFKNEGELVVIARGLIFSVALHGMYNFVVALYARLAIVSLLPLMVFMAWLMDRRIKEFRSQFPFPVLADGALIVCPTCGAYTREAAEACPRCGVPIPLLATDDPRFCGRCRARLDPCRSTCSVCGCPTDLSRYCTPG